MVFIATSLVFVAAVYITTLVSAAPAERGKPDIIPVRKGTSGKHITAKDVVERDLARIAVYNRDGESTAVSARASSGTAINKDVTYVAQVSICSQTFDLTVDTGSSNTWVRIMSSDVLAYFISSLM
jgi:Eukaryotic aspartyl protease